jgi:hypothetical protein
MTAKRSEKQMKKALKKLRKVWEKYPKLALCELVDSNVADIEDEDFVGYCEAVGANEVLGIK